MKLPTSATQLTNEIYHCVDQQDNLGDLRLRQLIMAMKSNLVSPALIVSGSLEVFSSAHRHTVYEDQSYAGKILLEMNPKPELDLKSILDRTLGFWNKSVSQLPHWLKSNFDRETIMDELKMISESAIETENKKENAKAMIWWIDQK